MKRHLYTTCAISLLMAGAVAASSLRLKLVAERQESFVWEPLTFRAYVVNDGRVPVVFCSSVVAQVWMSRDGTWVRCYSGVAAGLAGRGCRIQVARGGGDAEISLRFGGCVIDSSTLRTQEWRKTPGTYRFKAILHHHGTPPWPNFYPPLPVVDGMQAVPLDADLESNVAEVTVKPATGIDAEALPLWVGRDSGGRPSDVLVRYPSCRYVAYVAGWMARESRTMPPEQYFPQLNGTWPPPQQLTYVPDKEDPEHKVKELRFGGPYPVTEGARWEVKWLAQALSYHPEVWFAGDLRLEKASDEILLKDYAAAKTDLELLATEDKEVGMKALKYLALMVKDGMIKPEAIPEKLRAKLPKVELRTRTPAAKK